MNNDTEKAAKDGLKKVQNFPKILTLFLSPTILFLGAIFIFTVSVFVAILMILGLIGTDSSEECIDLKSADEICKSISVVGYGTMSVDDYVAGVISQEVKGFDSYTNGIEVMKANVIAARTYAFHEILAGSPGFSHDSSGNCSVPAPSENTQDFDIASEVAKQVANETSGMILVDSSGSAAFTQFSSILLTKPYNDFGSEVTLMENDGSLSIPKTWIESNVNTCKEGIKTNPQYGGYGCGHGHGMSQWGALYLAKEKNYDYEKIIEYYYYDDGFELASSNGSSRSCKPTNNGTLQPLKNYKTNHDGLEVLSHTLSESERESLDDYLNKQINAAGYGTGAGVAAAGQSLVYWLEQKGLYLQYFWGGGQGAGDNTVVGASPNWGSTSYGADFKGHGKYFGMDCSGFVSWAVRTACAPNSGSRQAEGWMSFGPEISLKDAKPGDVIAHKDHVMLVVKNNGDGTVYVAEESNDLGFTLVDSDRASGRKVVDMTKWYKDNCDKKKGA